MTTQPLPSLRAMCAVWVPVSFIKAGRRLPPASWGLGRVVLQMLTHQPLELGSLRRKQDQLMGPTLITLSLGEP